MKQTWVNLWLVKGQIEDRKFDSETAMLLDILHTRQGHSGQITYQGTAYINESGWRGIDWRLDDAWSERDYMDRETAAEDRHIAFEMRRG